MHKVIRGPSPREGENINPAEIREQILAGKTRFGRFIKPLVEQLTALPPGKQKENMQTLELVYGFVKGREKDLAGIGFSREDSLFLVTDPVGALIRRPVVHTHFAQGMEEQLTATEPDERKLKAVFVKGLRANAWSRFVADEAGIRGRIKAKYPSEEVFVDYMENASRFEELMTECPVYAYGMVRQAVDAAIGFYNRYAKPIEADYFRDKEGPNPPVFLTDPGHAFGVKADLNLYDAYADHLRMHDYMSVGDLKLVGEASFMLVEDNPPHTTWAKLLGDVKKLSFFKPAEGFESADERTRAYEARGVYSSAERALEVMDSNGVVPNVVLSDIELGSGMNGIDLVRKLHEEHPDAIILMVYSSNPGAYDLKSLRDEGVICGAWDKKEFKPHHMIETINEEMMRRGKAGN